MRGVRADKQQVNKSPIKLKDKSAQYICEQNQKFSQMLLDMFNMNQDYTTKQVDYQGYQKLLAKFNEAVKGEIAAMQAGTKGKQQIIGEIEAFAREEVFRDSKQLVQQDVLGAFLSLMRQKQNQLEVITQKIEKSKQDTKTGQYELQIQARNKQMQSVLWQKKSNSIKMKNKLQKLTQQREKAEKYIKKVQKQLFMKQIQLRQLESQNSRLTKS